jgi:hypothetical protein
MISFDHDHSGRSERRQLLQHNDSEKVHRWGSRKEAMTRARIGATKLHELISQNRIRARKLDGKTLVDLNSVDELIENSPAVGPNVSA